MAKSMGPMGNLMKRAQKMQSDIAKLQDELATRTVEATAGGGMVKIVANGKQELVSIKIEREVVDPDDLDMLQDLILAAVNEALKQSQDMVSREMQKVTGGLSLPGLF